MKIVLYCIITIEHPFSLELFHDLLIIQWLLQHLFEYKSLDRVVLIYISPTLKRDKTFSYGSL